MAKPPRDRYRTPDPATTSPSNCPQHGRAHRGPAPFGMTGGHPQRVSTASPSRQPPDQTPPDVLRERPRPNMAADLREPFSEPPRYKRVGVCPIIGVSGGFMRAAHEHSPASVTRGWGVPARMRRHRPASPEP